MIRTKLTPRSALLLTREIWLKLAKNGRRHKPTAPRYEQQCPCCEYVCQQKPDERLHGMNCSDSIEPDFDSAVLELCPLKKLWPKGCCHSSALFWRWNVGDNETRKAFAQQIADGCDAALAELDAAGK